MVALFILQYSWVVQIQNIIGRKANQAELEDGTHNRRVLSASQSCPGLKSLGYTTDIPLSSGFATMASNAIHPDHGERNNSSVDFYDLRDASVSPSPDPQRQNMGHGSNSKKKKKAQTCSRSKAKRRSRANKSSNPGSNPSRRTQKVTEQQKDVSSPDNCHHIGTSKYVSTPVDHEGIAPWKLFSQSVDHDTDMLKDDSGIPTPNPVDDKYADLLCTESPLLTVDNFGTYAGRAKANPLKYLASVLRYKIEPRAGEACDLLQIASEIHEEAKDKHNTALRRIYDVVNVLDAAGLIERLHGRNMSARKPENAASSGCHRDTDSPVTKITHEHSAPRYELRDRSVVKCLNMNTDDAECSFRPKRKSKQDKPVVKQEDPTEKRTSRGSTIRWIGFESAEETEHNAKKEALQKEKSETIARMSAKLRYLKFLEEKDRLLTELIQHNQRQAKERDGNVIQDDKNQSEEEDSGDTSFNVNDFFAPDVESPVGMDEVMCHGIQIESQTDDDEDKSLPLASDNEKYTHNLGKEMQLQVAIPCPDKDRETASRGKEKVVENSFQIPFFILRTRAPVENIGIQIMEEGDEDDEEEEEEYDGMVIESSAPYDFVDYKDLLEVMFPR